MKPLRMSTPTALSDEDLVLCIHGPWHPDARCSGSPTVLWDARVDTERLRTIWRQHADAIRTAAWQVGVQEPWIESRLFFCDIIDGTVRP
jgi:hypothetical protein